MDKKQALRQSFRARRAALDPALVIACSEMISSKVLELPVWQTNPSRVHIYTSHSAWGEVDTALLVRDLAQRFPALRVTMGQKSLHAQLPTDMYDVIIVPVLAYDAAGYRLGLGAGWYDQFLAAQQHAVTIGLAYRWALCDDLPHEAYDIPLVYVVTD